MISRELAERFIENVTRYTEYNVNIMDGDGTIIASRDPERVGRYHEVAYRIIKGNEDIVDTTDIREFSNVLPGINMVIEVDGVREGVVGVTGDPKEIRPVALIVKMAIETMLKYERQQEAIRLRENRKERFIYMLTQVEHSDPAELRNLAEELGYPEEMIRIPILIRLKGMDPGEVMHFLRNSALHTKMDFSFVLDPSHIIIFKTLPGKKKDLFSYYKFEIGEYLSPLLRKILENGTTASFYVGSFQDSYSRYYYAFQHAAWLERYINAGSKAVFFYDYAGAYLQNRLPFGELQNIFQLFEKHIPKEKLLLYMQCLGVLIRTNFNFGKAADELFIHKNTLVYRYNKLKELMNMDPLASASDRSFLGSFYLYLERNGFFRDDSIVHNS